MKLLYITNGINGSGGLERVLSVKASNLADQYDYNVTILSLNDNHLNPFYKFSDKIKMASISVGGTPFSFTKRYVQGIRRIVADFKPDVISVCDDGLKGFFVPRIIGHKVPTIYERHASVNLNFKKADSNPISAFKNKTQYALMQSLGASFNKFIVLTNGNLKEWKSNNLKVIPNPLSFYPKNSATLNDRTVIAVGSHSYNKGYDLLLLAWKQVVERYGDWHLEIYGKIDQNETYLKQAEHLGLNKSVKFLHPVKDIKEKYLKSSIMVLPSRSEGFGMVLIEAMACGLPCVSFDCPHGPADIIQEGLDGFLVENGNINELASKITILIENENLRKQMGIKAKENAKFYLPEDIVKQWDILFKNLVH